MIILATTHLRPSEPNPSLTECPNSLNSSKRSNKNSLKKPIFLSTYSLMLKFFTKRRRYVKNNSSLNLEYFWQPEKNQRKKFVLPDRREGEGMFYPSVSEVKTLPLSGERAKHSSEGCFSGSPKIFQVIGYFFSVRSLPNKP